MEELTVRNPVAEPAGRSVPPARRLPSLEGARIGLWWNQKDGGDVALEELGRLLKARFGISELRFYGTFPAKQALISQAAGESDAIVGATADCGSCTSWLVHDLIEIEKLGAPTVALVADEFLEDARQSARVFGIADLRLVRLPRILTSLGPEEIRLIASSLEDRVVEGLSGLTDSEGGSASDLPSWHPDRFSYRAPRFLDALCLFQQDYLARLVGDGYPLVPPTDEAVSAMLAGTSLAADEEIAVLEPGHGIATVEKVAINSVMAGCRPGHMPILIAATRAITDSHFNLRGVAMSTGAHGMMLLVNGPIVGELGINSGRAAFGPGAPSAVNVVIARAMRLILMNIGYAYVGLFDMDTQGTVQKMGICVGENEEKSPWEPFHVARGFDPAASVVSVFSVESEIEIQDLYNFTAEGFLATVAGSMSPSGACSLQHSYLEKGQMDGLYNLLVLSPDHATVAASGGWSRDVVRKYLFEESAREAKYVLAALRSTGLRPERRWILDKAPDDRVPVMESLEWLNICVVGGAGSKSKYLTGLGVPQSAVVDPYRSI
jgi:hypothetical protein